MKFISKIKNSSFKEIEGEIWKEIEDFPDYIVSNFGRVRRQFLNNRSHCSSEDGCLSPSYSSGYAIVILRKDNKSYYKRVHQLVAKAFIPNPNNYTDVNHKDENKQNNKADNLEWCTETYNNCYNDRHIKVGEKIRKYVKIYEWNGKDYTLIDTCKTTDVKKYHISNNSLYKYLDTDITFVCRKTKKFYKLVSV